jgi:hypothetical protein
VYYIRGSVREWWRKWGKRREGKGREKERKEGEGKREDN